MAAAANIKFIYLAGGYFWGVSEYFSRIPGIVSVTAGYANSKLDSPSYEQVKSQQADAAETVKVGYDPSKLTLTEILRAFFLIIDPLSVNRQGEDSGRSYRTGVYYTDLSEKPEIAKVFSEVERKLGKQPATELLPLENFFKAEEYHQDYLKKHPGGYCHVNFKNLQIFKEELEKAGHRFEKPWQI